MIQHFIKHLNNASVMDLLLKGERCVLCRDCSHPLTRRRPIVIACEETAEGGGVLAWLCNTDLIPCLVGKFAAANGADVHENAAQVAVECWCMCVHACEHTHPTHRPAQALVDIISVSGAVASSPLIRQLEVRGLGGGVVRVTIC
jgi:hypothetical protein